MERESGDSDEKSGIKVDEGATLDEEIDIRDDFEPAKPIYNMVEV